MYGIWNDTPGSLQQGAAIPARVHARRFEMKKITLILTISISTCASLAGQQLAVLRTNRYGGAERDIGNAVHQTNDGGYIIAGMTESFGAGSGDV